METRALKHHIELVKAFQIGQLRFRTGACGTGQPQLTKNVLKSDYFLMNDRNGYLETYWADLNDFFTG